MPPVEPFWPRVSPHFLACRRAVRLHTDAARPHTDAAHPAIIGLSGGPDSLALVAAAAAEGCDVRAVVVDHGLQEGTASVAEQARAKAEKLGVPATIARVEVETAPGESVEAAAREARYQALFAEAAADGSDVWVAHTLDDQAETLLLGALRGNPAGMPAVTEAAGGRLVRPFLQIRRADTAGACDELGLQPWHDPMNDDTAYRRVAVRKSIIPALSDLIGGDAAAPLAKTAERIVADNALVDEAYDLSPTNDCAELAADPAPIRQRRIRAWLRTYGVELGGGQVGSVDRLCVEWRGQGPVDVAGARVGRANGRLYVE
ncbi:tRNA lysidine(34) synthetase TilS [Corynebacterium sp. CCUG 70398]|uniref:tRNA lysidine(34) synthetase TilS n=1 Tax=Corynebacterium sp. CCUG 70398 TaxID=2823891 RepID=UPI00210D5469|nr:tRNA lysidine(34) synthetase TilS [Corynebacterium sp. CCUG 70398]MCQ4623604.1 tRNA lysidine(34) synthetase TilS [Corynebacterium sp. CCUG 70398]